MPPMLDLLHSKRGSLQPNTQYKNILVCKRNWGAKAANVKAGEEGPKIGKSFVT